MWDWKLNQLVELVRDDDVVAAAIAVSHDHGTFAVSHRFAIDIWDIDGYCWASLFREQPAVALQFGSTADVLWAGQQGTLEQWQV